MIAVQQQPEPPDFDTKVRQKGVAWMRARGIADNQPLPKGTHLKEYWRECKPDVYERYGRCCAYLAVYKEDIGDVTIDHFIPKSLCPDLAYEWSNYRLASALINARKGQSRNVLDPFAVQNGWFHLELVTGHIYPNPALDTPTLTEVQATIARLKLDNANYCGIRKKHFLMYLLGDISETHLKTYSPFVWSEANRQGLL
ncbi:MAG: hypothetical protein IJM64_08225 [Ottowia sp.]|nr:hypothetical protein [Ottowia sp.]